MVRSSPVQRTKLLSTPSSIKDSFSPDSPFLNLVVSYNEARSLLKDDARIEKAFDMACHPAAIRFKFMMVCNAYDGL